MSIDPDSLVYKKGCFQDPLPRSAMSIALVVSLCSNGVLHKSTKVFMKYLHPLIPKGGCVIIDDYGFAVFRKAVFDYWYGRSQQPDLKIA
jgi:hypothetical protein